MVGAEGISWPIHLAQGAYPNLKQPRSACSWALCRSLVPRTTPRSDQKDHRKPRKPLSQLSFLAQKSTYGHSPVRTAPGWPTSRSRTRVRYFFYFVFIHSRDPKFFLGRFSADTRVPELSKQLSKTSYIYIYIYICISSRTCLISDLGCVLAVRRKVPSARLKTVETLQITIEGCSETEEDRFRWRAHF